ncbi:MAG: mechanosensitive ion channel [Proteobacteria bacterium]|nr:mechanosensitive ion channel [Pseudomonadota bacterium]MDA1058141.1 mechanosensitive ion channel [Pseudomonadota bacterium]
MNEEVDVIIKQILEIVSGYGLAVVGAIVILVVGLWVSGRVSRLVNRTLSRSSRVDATVAVFLSSLTRYALVAVTLIAVLNQFGIQTTSLIAVLGAATLAIGLALQGTLSNVAAGVMLLLFRPFKVNDYVEVGGIGGTVKAVTLFLTEMVTPDNIEIVVPNGQVWGAVIKNFNYNPTRRCDINVGISYDDNIGDARAAVLECIAADPRALQDPAPAVVPLGFGDSSVDLQVRVWAKTEEFWAFRFALIQAIKEKFDERGITIPYPIRTIIQEAK